MRNIEPDIVDCLIVGGGAAGLAAAIYLARFRRNVLVVDSGASRLALIPVSHNYPGFPEGVPGKDLLARLRDQAEQYGARLATGKIEALEKIDDGSFSARVGGEELRARTVLLATGVQDVAPEMEGHDAAMQSGCLRYCPVCDGYEAIGKKVAVLGRGQHGVEEACFIKHFADDLTLLTTAPASELSGQHTERMQAMEIAIVDCASAALACENAQGILVRLPDGAMHRFDVLYAALGTRVDASLAQGLGAECDVEGHLLVDAHCQTSIEDVYAAGDIVAGLNQISVASGQAAIAATAIHNRLKNTAC